MERKEYDRKYEVEHKIGEEVEEDADSEEEQRLKIEEEEVQERRQSQILVEKHVEIQKPSTLINADNDDTLRTEDIKEEEIKNEEEH